MVTEALQGGARVVFLHSTPRLPGADYSVKLRNRCTPDGEEGRHDAKVRVLVIEDDPEVSAYLSDDLEAEGWDVALASTAAEAVESRTWLIGTRSPALHLTTGWRHNRETLGACRFRRAL